MIQTIHHPLRRTEARLVRALRLNGVTLLADHQDPELIETDWGFEVCTLPDHLKAATVEVEGPYQMRTNLLGHQLPRLYNVEHIDHFCVGQVYDAGRPERPNRSRIEGLYACPKLEVKRVTQFWTSVARLAFDVTAAVSVAPVGKHAYSVEARLGETAFELAYLTLANSLARTLTNVNADEELWVFVVDVDAVATSANGLRDLDALYSPLVPFLESFPSSEPSLGALNMSHAANLLRQRGFLEFCGDKVYEPDCYKKMNMIQESWDTNNRGVLLDEPLAGRNGLPTVLTPALEEALAANWRAGVKDCKLFEFAHIFLPSKTDGPHKEKISLSFGAYGCDLDGRKWKALVDQFLTDFGIANHFFIPTDMAIAYDQTACWIVLDEHMSYLDCNCGGISPKALANHGIGVPAFMAQFEFDTLERKADEELAFVPNEL